MSNLMTSAVGVDDSAAQLAASKPIARSATLPESSARLKLDHEEFVASLRRLRDFAVAGDPELAQGEWDELEVGVLRHIDAEEMFLLPGFAREAPVEAAAIHAEHAEIRRKMGEVGLALDLHTLRLEQVDEISRMIIEHGVREERTLFPWALREGNSPLLDAIARRLPHRLPDRTREARTTTTLLALLRVCRDGEQGYRRALRDADDAAHQTLFTRLAEDRARFGQQLRDELKSLGVSAQFKGTLMGALHRGWIEASAKLSASNPKLILRECERGEELGLRVYRSALRTDLPAPIRSVVEAQYGALDRALSEIRAVSATVP